MVTLSSSAKCGWCVRLADVVAGRHHALQVACTKLATASDEDKAYISALMGSIEQDKLELIENNFKPEDRATAYVRVVGEAFLPLRQTLLHASLVFLRPAPERKVLTHFTDPALPPSNRLPLVGTSSVSLSGTLIHAETGEESGVQILQTV